jgi:cation diffusion facilitator CzcD-associated flavoprotein CzcO
MPLITIPLISSQNVLLVGASVSSTDIAKELGPFAKKLYQVSRGGLFDLPTDMLPENATRVAEVASFNFSTDSQSSKSYDSQAIQGSVTLVNGEVLSNIDRVLICTGYHCSFPFLRDLHRDSIPPESADDEALVTDGTQIHNLHKDIFYIPDPTLAFVGVPYHVATFTLFEFQAIAIAAVVSGKAKLPTEQAMRDEYRRRVEEKGHGKAFHSLKGKDVEYANELLEWINEDRKAAGDQLIAGHTEKWHEAMLEFQMR